MEDAAIKAVTESTEVEIPSGMIETELDNMIKDMETRMSYQGITMEQYLGMIGKTMEDFKKENEEQAKASVKTRCQQLEEATERRCRQREKEAELKYADFDARAKEAAEKRWNELSTRLEAFYKAHQGIKELLTMTKTK